MPKAFLVKKRLLTRTKEEAMTDTLTSNTISTSDQLREKEKRVPFPVMPYSVENSHLLATETTTKTLDTSKPLRTEFLPSSTSAFQPVSAQRKSCDFSVDGLLRNAPPTLTEINPMHDLLRWDLYYKVLGYGERRAAYLSSLDAGQTNTSPENSITTTRTTSRSLPGFTLQRDLQGSVAVAAAMTNSMFANHRFSIPMFPPNLRSVGNLQHLWGYSGKGLAAFPPVGRRPVDPNKPPPVKKYKCDVCGKAFSRSNTLVTHKRIHTGDKPFVCDQCGRAFRQPGNLTRHRLTHTTIKPYVCPQCNKAFNRASNLHTHMRTHTNYRPFICQYCGKGFHQKIDMKIHSYTHTGEKPHKCKKCGRGFKQLTHLTYHMRTHSEVKMYTCEFCGKGFNQKGNLQAHIYGHTGERPYKCELCTKGFTLASTLNTHRRTHADFKPYVCKHCGKDFYHRNALKSHLLASHPYTGLECKL